jgi:hypothetical protein
MWRADVAMYSSVLPNIVSKRPEAFRGTWTLVMRKHARKYWGDEVVTSADKVKNVKEVWDTTIKGSLDSQSITAAFERKGKGKVTYSHRQHMKTKLKAEIVQWVSKSMRPFEIVEDRGFQCLMKTGQPEYYIPSQTTVSHVEIR